MSLEPSLLSGIRLQNATVDSLQEMYTVLLSKMKILKLEFEESRSNQAHDVQQIKSILTEIEHIYSQLKDLDAFLMTMEQRAQALLK